MKVFVIHFVLLAIASFWPAAAEGQAGIVSRSTATAVPRANRWRYVWHNDRWWYWTAKRSWDYFDGRRWLTYEPRRPLSGPLTGGYRRAPAFESPPAAAPLRPFALNAQTAGVEAEFGEPLPAGSEESVTPSLPGPLRAGKRFDGLATPGRGAPEPSPNFGRGRAAAGSSASGGGGFGGPTGRSLGAGSAAGGASTPQ